MGHWLEEGERVSKDKGEEGGRWGIMRIGRGGEREDRSMGERKKEIRKTFINKLEISGIQRR